MTGRGFSIRLAQAAGVAGALREALDRDGDTRHDHDRVDPWRRAR